MKKIIYLTAILLVVFTSCKKQGCMDTDAYNFDSAAEKDNGTCEYKGDILFWWNEETKNDILNNTLNANVLRFALEGEVFKEVNPNIFWTEAPDCNDVNSISCTKYLGSAKEATGIITIKHGLYNDNLFGATEWHMDFEANKCIPYQIQF